MLDLPAPTARDEHARRIAQLIHAGAADTRPSIAAATGMSASLVSRVTSDLLRTGVLVARPDDGSEGPGRPAERLAIRPEAGRTVGAEVADGRIRLVACGATGELLDARTEDLASDVSEATVARLVAAIRAWAAPNDPSLPPLLGVGVALHDVVTTDGGWMRADAPARTTPARALLSDALGVPVIVEDVSRAFADAEHRFGAGRDSPDMLYLFLGRDGVGSGIFAGDVPLRSRSGICGEIGHIPVVPDGDRCTCGNRGCLETVATHAALVESARRYLDQGVHSKLTVDATFHDLMAAARKGDKVATLVMHELVRYLGTSLTGAISVTGATTVVLGGDVRESGDALPELLRQELKRSLLQPLAQAIDVRYAELPETAGARSLAVAALEAAVQSGLLAWSGRERGVVM